MIRHLLLPILFVSSLYAQADWDEPFEPHKIADNLYYVGSKGLSTYLITTKAGHIVINSSFERTVPIIQSNIEKLGFKMKDVKIILTSHAHDDHVAGNARLKEITGAKVYVMKGDERAVETGGEGVYLYKSRWKPVKVDKVLEDGEKVALGDAILTAHLTPGHTPGCTTWTMKATESGKTYDVVIVGSPNVNPGYVLKGNQEYPQIASDFARCFRVLKALHCDIFLGAHGAYYNMVDKYQNRKAGVNPFVDPKGYQAYIADREQHYKKVLAGGK